MVLTHLTVQVSAFLDLGLCILIAFLQSFPSSASHSPASVCGTFPSVSSSSSPPSCLFRRSAATTAGGEASRTTAQDATTLVVMLLISRRRLLLPLIAAVVVADQFTLPTR
ncbi:unnamed protein product [Linum tenue]|uniref:Secreted peptide n=1 Tax=Linum tenue TaxID=586396 RepID=A0AAV0M6Z6_9ROSI|nr:unnamed protein product [Linum tenue]